MQNNFPKIFFFDLDGTLLNDEKIITSATRQALEDFVAAGNYFVINTGRAIDSAKHVKQQLGLNFQHIFLIGFNGGLIYDCDNKQNVYRAGMDLNLVNQMGDLAKKHGIHFQSYTDEGIISLADDQELAYYRKVIPSPYVISDPVTLAMTEKPCKCLAIELEDHDKMEAFRKEATALAGDALTILYSNPYYLEIFPSISGKGSAVTNLCHHLNIPVENSLAAGDEQNDISMIQAAGLGIAMCNGTDAVKEAADVVTKTDNNHDGLLPFLRLA